MAAVPMNRIAIFEGYNDDCDDCDFGDGGVFTKSNVGIVTGAVTGAWLAKKMKPGNTTFMAVGAIVGGIMGSIVGNKI